jgi:DNA-binding GntR family transcriptional regulator
MDDNAQPVTLRNLAHDRFMDRLYSGALRPAQLVSQRELCALLDLPLGPIREALKRLEGEGIVTLIPQRGIKILDIDEKTINDAFQMRLLVEIEAVRIFTERGDIAVATELRERTRATGEKDRPRAALNLDEINAVTALDHEMHRLFVSAMQNDFATELFDRVLGRLRLSRLVFRLRNYTDERAIREHLSILDAVIEGDGARAAEAMTLHLKASWRRAMGLAD